MRKSVGGKGFAFSAALLYNRTNTLGWSGEFRTGMEAVTDEDSDCHERRRGLKRRGRAFVQGRQRVHRRDDEALSQRGHRCQPHAHTCCSLDDVEDATKLVALQASASPTMSSTFSDDFEEAGHRPLRLVPTKRGLDAKPLHRLQPLPEVRAGSIRARRKF